MGKVPAVERSRLKTRSAIVVSDTTQHTQKAPAAERSRCSLRASPAHSLRSFAGSVLASQGVPRSGCPFQSHPPSGGSGVARGGMADDARWLSGVRCGADGARE